MPCQPRRMRTLSPRFNQQNTMSKLLPCLAAIGGFATVAIASSSLLAANAGNRPPESDAAAPEPASEQPPFLAPSLTATGEIWSDRKGGHAQGSRWNTLVDLGISIDLAQLAAPQNSELVAQVFWVKNQRRHESMCNLTGAFNPVSGLQAGDQIRVFNLHYRQTWADDTCAVKIGQIAIDDDFMGSEYAGLFANSAFGAMPSQVATPLASDAAGTPAFPVYSVAAPGLQFMASLSDSNSWLLGVYHGGPGPDEKDNHGFDWEPARTSGVVAFLESVWHGSLAGRTSTFRVGGSCHTAKFDDLLAINTGKETGTTTRGLYSFYVSHDLTLMEDSKGAPAFGVFWRAGLNPQPDRCVVHTYFDAGFKWFSPLPGRTGDVVGIAMGCTEFGREYRRLTGSNTLARRETTAEVTYRAQITDLFALQADLQFLGHHSDQTDSGTFHTATVVGLRSELSF